MKKKVLNKNFTLASFMLLLFLIGCLDESVYMKTPESPEHTSLTVKEAMEYFNANVDEFHLSSSGKGRAADEELFAFPVWEQGKKVTFKKKEVIEVPIEAPITIVRLLPTSGKSDGNNEYKFANTIYRLIADKQEDNSFIYTIARITLDDAY